MQRFGIDKVPVEMESKVCSPQSEKARQGPFVEMLLSALYYFAAAFAFFGAVTGATATGAGAAGAGAAGAFNAAR